MVIISPSETQEPMHDTKEVVRHPPAPLYAAVKPNFPACGRSASLHRAATTLKPRAAGAVYALTHSSTLESDQL